MREEDGGSSSRQKCCRVVGMAVETRNKVFTLMSLVVLRYQGVG
jgi:hypothetical protein